MERFALVVAAGLLAGCGVGFNRLRLDPPATTEPSDARQARVREVGAGYPLGAGDTDGKAQTAVTVDVHNGSAAPLVLDLAGATITYESVGAPDRMVAGAIGGGPRGLPGSIGPRAAVSLRPLTLAPGEARTFWIAFERFTWPANARVTLRIPVAGGGAPLRLVLRDPAVGRPLWVGVPARRFGLSLRLEGRFFGPKGDEAIAGNGLWLTRGPFRLDLGYWIGVAYVPDQISLQRTFTFGLGPGVAWHVPRTVIGFYGSGALNFRSFRDQAGLDDQSWSPGFSVGIESGSDGGPTPFMFFRLGWMHVFDERLGAKDGVSLYVGKNVPF